MTEWKRVRLFLEVFEDLARRGTIGLLFWVSVYIIGLVISLWS